MRYIENTFKTAYKDTKSRVFASKSAFIGLCADIDRFFLLSFNIKMNEKINNDKFEKVCEVFPNLSGLTCEQFNRILILFSNIRAVNAHLFKNSQIFLDEDLASYFTSIAKPKYLISNDKKLTLYGAFYILSFLSCKYQIWTFVTSFFRKSAFEDENEKNNFALIQQDMEKYHQKLCGTGKVVVNCNDINESNELQYLTSVCKTSLTVIFFTLEKIFYKPNKPTTNPPSFRQILKSANIFDDEIIENISKLRNCWMHGKFVNDTFIHNNETCVFNLNLIIETMFALKERLKDDSQYEKIIVQITEFGQSLFNFYLLRILEISYKVLDNRLLTAEKIEERAINLLNAFNRFNKEKIELYKKISMIMDDLINYQIVGVKFQDGIARRIKTEQVKICHLHSDNGFQIGSFYTRMNDLYLANLDIKPEFQNKINGKYLSEYEYKTITEYSHHISYCEE